MNELWLITSSIFTGMAICAFFMLIFSVFQKMEVDNTIEEETTNNLPLLIKLFMPLAPNARRLAKHDVFETMRKQMDTSLSMAGFSQQINAEDFIAVRILLFILGLILMLIMMFAGYVIAGMLIWLCCYIYPGAWLKSSINRRHREIMKALPNILDLLSLSVEAGKDFLNSLRDVLARRKSDALGEELSRTFKEIQLGKKRVTALRDLVNRVRQPDLTTVMNAIIQADELGVSIGNLLRIQSELLRNKRFTRAEKLAAEAPVKMLFPMALFIFPAVLLILMAPIILQALAMF